MDKIQVEKPDFIVGIDDVKIPCFEKTFVSANELCVAVGTTGHKGGDSGHGGRTYFRLTNDCCTDMNISVIDEHSYEHDFDSANGVTIMLGGDCELDYRYFTAIGDTENANRFGPPKDNDGGSDISGAKTLMNPNPSGLPIHDIVN